MAIFVVAVLSNYLWELAQSPLYVGLEDIRTTLWHCFVASLGDGLMVLSIVASGGIILRRPDWRDARTRAHGGRGQMT
jgi:hypothetical protein